MNTYTRPDAAPTIRTSAMKFNQYDVARLKCINAPIPELDNEFNWRRPVLGDIATIIEIYARPLDYELECCDWNGITEWMMAFPPDDIELELVL